MYLHNVAPTTLEWYTHAFKWLPSESPAADELKDAVVRMRTEGLKATGRNSAIRAINAYLTLPDLSGLFAITWLKWTQNGPKRGGFGVQKEGVGRSILTPWNRP